jgi:altronate hydrolase
VTRATGHGSAKSHQPSVLAIRVHPQDNVAVVAADVSAGGAVHLDDGTNLRAVEAIARGNKVALSPIASGEAVIRYGEEIGKATQDIAAGQHVHTHNMRRGE